MVKFRLVFTSGGTAPGDARLRRALLLRLAWELLAGIGCAWCCTKTLLPLARRAQPHTAVPSVAE